MALLEIKRLQASYGDLTALSGIDLFVEAGEVVAIIGANGAGKTTLLRSIAGLHRQHTGTICLEQTDITHERADRIARAGIATVPEGRHLFASLTVKENLLTGRAAHRTGYWNLSTVYDLFPMLGDIAARAATKLSGGQQQMVAIGRALMSNPRLLICDEVSLGLAPTIIKDIYDRLPLIRQAGVSMIIVEQDVARACAVSNRVYCLLSGRISLQGRPADFSREEISQAYFGV